MDTSGWEIEENLISFKAVIFAAEQPKHHKPIISSEIKIWFLTYLIYK